MRILASTTIGLLLCLYVNAQVTAVCGINLKLGMTKDDALKAVAGKCESLHVKDAQGPSFDELWFLRATQTPGHKTEGEWTQSLYFLTGALVTISKDVGTADDNSAGEIVNQIYIFTKEASDGGQSATITPTSEFERDGWRYRVVKISAGKHTLILQTVQPIGKPNGISRITLQESLSDH